MDKDVVEYTALLRYLLSGKTLDMLNFSFSCLPHCHSATEKSIGAAAKSIMLTTILKR